MTILYIVFTFVWIILIAAHAVLSWQHYEKKLYQRAMSSTFWLGLIAGFGLAYLAWALYMIISDL